ncbi:MAG: DUF839 domain-containing protein, partial [Bacteroidetes bacterium]|nr:DUF839 domain-containing protein [Bacteroidota bacterium]
MSVSRRHFLRTAGAFTMGFGGLHRLAAFATHRPSAWHEAPYSYGPLLPDPAGVMDLPDGFSYHILSRFGDAMDDGFLVPHRPDGMAAFPGPDGRTLLVRNHEVSHTADAEEGPFGPGHARYADLDARLCYDGGTAAGQPCMGGTTTVVYDTRTQTVERQYLSLAGTIRNCAGGPTPWNTWISCEETVERAGETLIADHGYNFEVPASAEMGTVEPVPLVHMGRFNHEAVAVDPASGIVYQTEDRHDGLIYRYLPDVPGELARGGRLQALVLQGRPSLDTRNWKRQTVQPGVPMAVTWIDLDDVEAPEDDLRLRGFDAGAARFARGEGMWYGEGAVFFACTNGGRARKGQIWRYVPGADEGTRAEADAPGTLELFVEPNDGAIIDNADNLTVAPWGDLIVCEDGSGEQFLVGVTPEGDLYKFARNAMNDS